MKGHGVKVYEEVEGLSLQESFLRLKFMDLKYIL